MIDASDEWTLYWSASKCDANRNALLELYVPFADSVAARICQKLPRAYSIEQAQSDAYLALIESIPRYKYGHGACFETFVGARIFGAIMDSLRQQDLLSRGARMSGITVTGFDEPVLISEYQAFAEIMCADATHLLSLYLPFDDQELLHYVAVENLNEDAVREILGISRVQFVRRLNQMVENAQHILINAA
jgi:hypothetical protein